MGGELLDDQGIHEGDDRDKPADDQDVCQNSGGAQEADGEKGQGCGSLVEVLSTTVNHYFPWFNGCLKGITDIRNQDLIIYQRQTIIWAALMALATKRQARMNISYQMRQEIVCENLKGLCGQEDLKNVPHGDTVEYLMMRLVPEELEWLQVRMIKGLLRNRVLEDYRLLEKYYTVAVDGLYTHSFDYEHCKHCLKRVDKETGRTVWFHAKLQASLVSPTGLCLPMASEWIENDGDYDKQDCEINAFKRLIVKLRGYFPKLPICLLLDALYGGQPIFEAIQEVRMEWIVVFKEGRWSTLYPWVMSIKDQCAKDNVILDVEEEEIEDRQKRSHEQRLERNKPQNKKRIRFRETTYTWMTGIEVPTKDRYPFNVMTCKDVVDGQKICDYVWLVSNGLNLNRDNVKALTQRGGRCRWKIENEGINTQKNGGYGLEHLYSRDTVSMKIWCALIDIAHTICQLIERGSLITMKIYGSLRNMAREMFDHMRYYVYRPPPKVPRIQIRLDYNTS
jgi:hypothetical protein